MRQAISEWIMNQSFGKCVRFQALTKTASLQLIITYIWLLLLIY